MTQPLVLSLFPGIGLLDRAFEEEGFCVVRGPDVLWGGDIHRFHPPRDRFDGVIGGPPCQEFSRLKNLNPRGGVTRVRGLGPFTPCRLCGARIDQLGREPRYFARHCDECKGAATERMKAWRRAAPIPKAVREAVIARDGHSCQHCGRPVRGARDRGDLAPDTIELDHLVPVSQGGASTVENLVVACLKCNRGRSNRPLPEVAA